MFYTCSWAKGLDHIKWVLGAYTFNSVVFCGLLVLCDDDFFT